MNNYESTIKFWDKRFGKILSTDKRYDPSKPMTIIEIEEGLRWLINETDSIIDFGCGTGNILFRSLFLGTKKAIGIDISRRAIELANDTSITNKMDTKTDFKIGGVELLKKIEDNSIEVGASFNTIDNILPDDAVFVLQEMNRILKNNGKLLIKLNDVIPKKVFDEDDYFQLISENFYKEKSGLYFWNLSDSIFKEIINPYFELVKYVDVPFQKTNYKNRLYYLENRK
ncbi:MAG: class I SAM-dependent methyltransferase [Candidatus Cloacimonetes bacterium]|nr:class I SAM-dependent methyltransferase [Candidatus Cloacimonadota bacterium]